MSDVAADAPIVGGWRLERSLAMRATREVWRVTRLTDGRAGVLKRLTAAASQSEVSRLAREARVLRESDNPQLPDVLDVDVVQRFIVLSEVPGRPIASLIRRPPLASDRVLMVGRALAEALRFLHRKGLAHRDVSASNVLVDGNQVYLVDFGAAWETQSELTGTGRAPGTAAYAPPEWGQDDVDWSLYDAFSLGVLLYELLVGARRSSEPLPLDPGVHHEGPDRALVRDLTQPDPTRRLTVAGACRRMQDLVAESTMDTFAGDDDPARPVADDPHGLIPGASLGRLQLEAEVGAGGMGRVFRAWDPKLRRTVAVKVLHAHLPDASRERFLREAQALARLNHAGLVRVLDVHSDGKVPHLILEFVDGTPLDRRLAAGPMAWERAATLGLELAEALAHAHEHAVIHRDVKPSNVLLDASGRARLTDFGIALMLDDPRTRLTHAEGIVGTPAYMAPEQVHGLAVTAATDVYALGALLYQCLCGRPPFVGNSASHVMHQVLARAPEPLPRTVPQALRTVVERAMALSPGDRYPTASALAEDLRTVLSGASITGVPLRARAQRLWQRRRRRVVLTLVATLLVGVTGVGAVGVLGWQRMQVAAQEAGSRDRLQVLTESLAILDDDQVESAFDTFLREPTTFGTTAEVDAWLLRSTHREQAGDLASARIAAARATGLAGARPDLALRSLRALDALMETGDGAVRGWIGLRAAAVDASDPLVRQGALATGEVAGLIPSNPAEAEVVRLLSHTTPSPMSGKVLSVLSIQGTHDFLFVGKKVAARVAWSQGGLVETQRWTLPSPGIVGVGQVAGQLVVLCRAGAARGELTALQTDGTTHVLAGIPVTSVQDVSIASLAPDAPPQLFIGSSLPPRDLFVVEPSEQGPWQVRRADPRLTAASSGVYSIDPVDLDDDGDDELLVSVGEWGAWDLRVLDDEQPGSMQTLARRTFGWSASFIGWPGPEATFVAVRRPRYAAPELFPTSPHHGGDPAIVLLDQQGENLVEREAIPLNDSSCSSAMVLRTPGGVGLLVSCSSYSMIVQRGGEGWTRNVLPGVRARFVVDIDDDGIDEVWARSATDRSWVLLGKGEAAFAPPPPIAHIELPDGLHARTRDQVSALHAIGAHAAAERLIIEMVALEQDDALAVAMLERAGDMALDDGRPLDALAVWSSSRALSSEELQLRRFEQLVLMARVREAAAVARRAMDAGWSGWSTRLEALLDGRDEAPTLTLASDLSGWQVVHPMAMRPHADAGWRLQGDGTILRRTVRWEGGPISLMMAGKTRWLDDRTGLHLRLRRGDETVVSASLSSSGVAQQELRVGCARPSSGHRPDRVMDHPGLEVRFLARADARPGGKLWCEGLGAVGHVVREERADVPALDVGEELELELTFAGSGTWSEIDLERIESCGLIPVSSDRSDTPTHRASRALSTGDPAAAEVVLDDIVDPVLREALRAVALDDRGEGANARQALATAMALGPIPSTWRMAWVRGRGGRMDSVLRTELGSAWADAVFAAYGTTLARGFTEHGLSTTLLARIDLDDLRADTGPRATKLALHRARALKRAQQLQAAEAHLDLVLDPAREARVHDQIAALQERARIAVADGRTNDAVDAARRALDLAPAPWLVGDRWLMDPQLRAAHAYPVWRSIFGPGVDLPDLGPAP